MTSNVFNTAEFAGEPQTLLLPQYSSPMQTLIWVMATHGDVTHVCSGPTTIAVEWEHISYVDKAFIIKAFSVPMFTSPATDGLFEVWSGEQKLCTIVPWKRSENVLEVDTRPFTEADIEAAVAAAKEPVLGPIESTLE